MTPWKDWAKSDAAMLVFGGMGIDILFLMAASHVRGRAVGRSLVVCWIAVNAFFPVFWILACVEQDPLGWAAGWILFKVIYFLGYRMWRQLGNAWRGWPSV